MKLLKRLTLAAIYTTFGFILCQFLIYLHTIKLATSPPNPKPIESLTPKDKENLNAILSTL